MKEYNRQVVIFGDFRSINFDITSKISDLMNKYKLTIIASPDYIPVNNLNGAIQINGLNMLQQPLPYIANQMRPILINQDKNLSVFIGTTRIHVEETNAETNSYDKFLSSAQEIIEKIVSVSENIYINRLAINGKFIVDTAEQMDNIYQSTFKDSVLYGKSSDEFSFRINTKVQSKAIRSEINKIISYNRTSQILPQNELKAIMFVDYDYNTTIKDDARFTVDDLSHIIKEGASFRSNIIA